MNRYRGHTLQRIGRSGKGARPPECDLGRQYAAPVPPFQVAPPATRTLRLQCGPIATTARNQCLRQFTSLTTFLIREKITQSDKRRGIMKSFLMAAAVAAVAVSPAKATDAPMMVSDFDWSGLYAGASVGYGQGSADWKNLYGTYSSGPSDFWALTLLSVDPEGGLAGATLGYNLQRNSLVYGIEAEWSFADMNAQAGCTGNNPGSYFATCKTDTKWLATLAGRIGVAKNRTLFFVKGGLALGHFEYNISDLNFDAPPYNTSKETKTGWMLGLGLEHAVNEIVTVKVEYNYMDFGSDRVKFSSGCGPYDCASSDFGTNVSQSVSTVRIGFNVRLGAN